MKLSIEEGGKERGLYGVGDLWDALVASCVNIEYVYMALICFIS